MRYKIKPVVAAVAATAALGMGTAYAAGESSTNRSAATNQQPAAMQGDQRATQQPATQAMVDARASRIIGMNVLDQGGKDIGEINDLIVDIANDRIHYAIVGYGGLLGLGEKEVAVPVSKIGMGKYRNQLVLNVSEQQLKDSPDIDRKVFNWNDRTSWSNVERYYHKTLGMPLTQGDKTRFRRATDVMGMDVVGAAGDEIGEIEDLVVNLSNGKIHYAVLEFDRAWNPFDKLVALPMGSFKQSADRDDLILNMTREQVAAAPSFESRAWPNLADTTFRDRVAGYGTMRDRGTVGMQQQPVVATTTILLIEEPEFLRLDKDRDGRLSREEVRSVSKLNQNWSAVDRNNDGYLTREELRDNTARANQSGQGPSDAAAGGQSAADQGNRTNPTTRPAGTQPPK